MADMEQYFGHRLGQRQPPAPCLPPSPADAGGTGRDPDPGRSFSTAPDGYLGTYRIITRANKS